MVYKLLRDKKGIGEYFWYILFFTIIAISLFFFKFQGEAFLGDQASIHDVQNSITHEQVRIAVLDVDPFTGRHTRTSKEIIGIPFSTVRELGVKIEKGDDSFFFEEEQYNRMNERAPIVFNKRITTLEDGTIISTVQELS